MTRRLPEPQPVSYPPPVRFYAKEGGENEETRLIPTPKESEWDFENIITEDDEPVDNLFSEKQQRLLTESLYSSWRRADASGNFVALANVGLFYDPQKNPLVPDVLVSLDVTMPADIWLKRNCSYFISEYGKPPEVVIEIVSNKKGKEDDEKLVEYASAGVHYYVIFDPNNQLKQGKLRLYELHQSTYVKKTDRWFNKVGLGLTLWKGGYENREEIWLRWCDQAEQLILTGKEVAAQANQKTVKAQQRAEQEHQRTEKERQRAERSEQRAEQMAAQLRALGIEPDQTR